MNINESIKSALAFLKAGNFAKASEIYREILRIQPDNVNALHFLGVICYEHKQYDAAIMYLKKALQLQPAYVEAYNNLGNVLHDSGHCDEAISCFRKALQLRPDFFESYVNLGNSLLAKGLLDETITCFRRALELNPDLLDLYFGLGHVLHTKGSLDEAITCFQKAVQLNPHHCGLYNELGILHQEKLQFDQAALCFQKALRLNPDFVESRINMGNTLQAKGLLPEAIACFQKTVELNPNSAYAHYNLSLALLMSGDFTQGWEQYEWRRHIGSLSYLQTNFSQPLWNGSDMKGGTVLVLGEQGFGDILQFIRYAPFVAQRNANVIVACHKELASLVQKVDGVQRTVSYGEQLPEFDAYCHLLSLPFIFRTSIEGIPSHIPYIRVDPVLEHEWRARIRSAYPDLKIGLVWSGNLENRKLNYKSCLLSTFSPLAEFDGITFYSLQKGEASTQAANPPQGMKFIDWTEKLSDFSDTAAFVSTLDLVVSVDTAVAHLAGALGKPVWTLLSFAPDWRWMLHRKDSPWYPTMRLFRQSAPGDWESVINQIKEALSAVLSGDQP